MICQWVRFVIDKLNSCHTNDDVEKVLRELPVGMEELYNGMAAKLIENLSLRDRALASSILQCVTCSLQVLTVTGLSQALNEDTSQILDFQRSVLDLCGGFTVIDNGGNVAVIHETAREYLLSDGICPLSIDRGAAHESMFLSCMRCLMTVGLRAKVSRKQKLEFLDYAASWWSSHLSLAPLDSRPVVEVLERFLTGHWVLIWIEFLAVSKQLRLLVQASRNLLRYCAKQEARESGGPLDGSSERLSSRSLFRSWAVDFVNIVGKFGKLLQWDSKSIYKLIPPFCPRSSSIYQQFGKSEARNLAVSGLSTTDWDDSLARLSTGFGTYTASIVAAGAQVAILTSPGNIFVYDSWIFEEGAASPFRHDEPVYKIAVNTAGTLLASYGYRTTKVWQISTGICKVSVENNESRSRPLAMLFTSNDTTLLVGTDDRRIRSLNLRKPTPTWELTAILDEPELEGHLLNSASNMALNPDGSLAAVTYRGHPTAAWELDGQFHIGHCWLRGREKVSYGEVIDACWHPHYPELLGLYLEGVVFKWRPYEDKCEEFPVAGVSRLELSKDGNLFATGDVHGTIKVYTTAQFKLIYQLSSQDPVLGLAFSPDSRRLYDIRGYYGNAWEPDALMRFAEQTNKAIDNESETDSLTNISAEQTSACHWIDSVTVLSSSPTGLLFCYGIEKGMVELHDVHRGKLDSLQASKSYLSIEAMCWSSDGKYVSFSDSSKTIFVLSIRASHESSAGGPFLGVKAQVSMKNGKTGHISQLLFNQNSTCLLVYTTSWIFNVSILNSSITRSSMNMSGCRWIMHPQDPGLIVGFGTDTVQVLDWDLKTRQKFTFEHPLARDVPDECECTVDRVLVAHNKEHVLVQTSILGQTSREKAFITFRTSSFSAAMAMEPVSQENTGSGPIASALLPHELSSEITLALSFLPDNRLVVLSRRFSICSWQLSFDSGGPLTVNSEAGSGSKTATKTIPSTVQHAQTNTVAAGNATNLFSLPGDWISRECLALCSIWAVERSLLCPRNGEVAVVRCAALA